MQCRTNSSIRASIIGGHTRDLAIAFMAVTLGRLECRRVRTCFRNGLGRTTRFPLGIHLLCAENSPFITWRAEYSQTTPSWDQPPTTHRFTFRSYKGLTGHISCHFTGTKWKLLYSYQQKDVARCLQLWTAGALATCLGSLRRHGSQSSCTPADSRRLQVLELSAGSVVKAQQVFAFPVEIFE